MRYINIPVGMEGKTKDTKCQLRIQSNWDSHKLLLGTQKDTASFENTWAVSYKVKCILPIRPSKLTQVLI